MLLQRSLLCGLLAAFAGGMSNDQASAQQVTAAVKLAPAKTAAEGEWTRFRGPNGTGLSMAPHIPTTWTASDYNWKVEIPGEGHSQPVIWGDKLFLTTAVGDERLVMCLSTETGKPLWTQGYSSKKHTKHKFNSFASATPACDEHHVYVAFSTPEEYDLIAIDHQGKEKWQVNLGPFESQHSCGTSPIVYEDMVVVGNEQDGPSSIVAVNRMTGAIRWKVPRRLATQGTAYSTPCVYQGPGANPLLIFNSKAHGVSAVEPNSGKLVWEAPLLTMRSVSSPVLAGENLIGSCGSGAGGNYIIAIKPGGQGDVSQTHLAYKLEGSSTMPYVTTPIVLGDLLFLWSDKGMATCVQATDDAKQGKKAGDILWQQRLGSNYFGSPVIVQDRIYNMSVDGHCVVLHAGREFKELARIDLGEGSHSTPAVAGGRMYLRTFTHLMSLGGKK